MYKRNAILAAATQLFSRNGFKETSMSELSRMTGAAGGTIFHHFKNKEDLFRQLARHRQNQAIDEAIKVLSGNAPLADRFIGAILAYEKVYYEPVSGSPHGEELMDISQSVAAEDMVKGRDKLVGHLAKAIEAAVSNNEADLALTPMKPKDFAELLMSSIGGQKK